jgi:CheY-like chemotaxis protein
VQAIAAVEGNRYDLVLMDVEMPGKDGLAATREIRSRLPLDRQPAVFGLTGHATTAYRDICLGAGMDGYLTKPLDPGKLQDLIEELSTQSMSRNLISSVTGECRSARVDPENERRVVWLRSPATALPTNNPGGGMSKMERYAAISLASFNQHVQHVWAEGKRSRTCHLSLSKFVPKLEEAKTLNYYWAPVCFEASARFAAQRFLVAAMIARLPAAESFRFGFGASCAAWCFLDSAHLFRCAAAIAALPALLIFRRLRRGDSEAAAVDWEPPSSICRISAIRASIRVFCISNPSIAAVRISVVSFIGM